MTSLQDRPEAGFASWISTVSRAPSANSTVTQATSLAIWSGLNVAVATPERASRVCAKADLVIRTGTLAVSATASSPAESCPARAFK